MCICEIRDNLQRENIKYIRSFSFVYKIKITLLRNYCICLYLFPMYNIYILGILVGAQLRNEIINYIFVLKKVLKILI